ncbi:MAG: kinase [Paenibacillus sp.]|nr:kinase [Paenibacillus sp.]
MNIHQLPADAVLIGRGKQGAVYKLSSDRCIKFYKKEENARLEYRSYRLAEGSPIVPKLYGNGPNYLILEFIQGEPMRQLLEKKGSISRSDSEQILYIIHEMLRLGFTRIDIALFHIYCQGASCKIIDLVNSYNKQYSIPKVMLKGLAKLGLLAPFLLHIKEMDPDLYKQWFDYLATRSDRYGNLRTFDE